MTYTAWFDGSFTSEKESSMAFVVLKNGDIVHSFSAPVRNLTNSTDAEATGLLYLLKYLAENNLSVSRIYTDCTAILKKLVPHFTDSFTDADPLPGVFLKEFSVELLQDFSKLIVWKKREYNLADSLCRKLTSLNPITFYSNDTLHNIKKSKLEQNLNKYYNSKRVSEIAPDLYRKRHFSVNHFSSLEHESAQIHIPNELLNDFGLELGCNTGKKSLIKIQECFKNGVYSCLGNYFYVYFNGLVLGISKGCIIFFSTNQTPATSKAAGKNSKPSATIDNSNKEIDAYGFLSRNSVLRELFSFPKNFSIGTKEVLKPNELPNGILASVYNRYCKIHPELNVNQVLADVLKNGTKHIVDGIEFYVLGFHHIFCINGVISLIRQQKSPYVKEETNTNDSLMKDKNCVVYDLNLPLENDFSRKCRVSVPDLSLPMLQTFYTRRKKSAPDLSFVFAFQDAYKSGKHFQANGFDIYVKGFLHVIVKSNTIIGFREQKSFLTQNSSVIRKGRAVPLST